MKFMNNVDYNLVISIIDLSKPKLNSLRGNVVNAEVFF